MLPQFSFLNTALARRPRRTQSLRSRQWQPEALEIRCLLSAVTLTPSINVPRISKGVAFDYQLDISKEVDGGTGQIVQIYFDSSQLNLSRDDLSYVLGDGLNAFDVQPDEWNSDGDESTDMLANFLWADFGGNWSGGDGGSTTRLVTASFTPTDAFTSTSINVLGDVSVGRTGSTANATISTNGVVYNKTDLVSRREVKEPEPAGPAAPEKTLRPVAPVERPYSPPRTQPLQPAGPVRITDPSRGSLVRPAILTLYQTYRVRNRTSVNSVDSASSKWADFTGSADGNQPYGAAVTPPMTFVDVAADTENASLNDTVQLLTVDDTSDDLPTQTAEAIQWRDLLLAPALELVTPEGVESIQESEITIDDAFGSWTLMSALI